MYPEFLHISFLHTYGVLVAVAFLVALWLTGRYARARGLNAEVVTNLGIYCAIAGIVGAKLMMFALDASYYVENPLRILSLETLQAGGVFYGGLILALVVAAWYMRKHRLAPLATADLFAPGIALGHAIGRIGCFSAGCCWGTQCDRSWAVTFTNPKAHDLVGVPLGVPLHPTQLYESAAELAIFAVLYRRPDIGLYLVLYSTARFVIEFYRVHDQANPFGGSLNASHFVALGMLAAGAAILVYRRRRKAPVKAGK
jgi:phosphatidylglycerol:prolipoprotein diacylglycerol transferase